MKNLLICLAFAGILSCSSEQTNYKQVISDFIQTDEDGTVYDLKLEIKTVTPLPPLTVSDSMKILKEDWEKRRQSFLESNQSSLKMYEKWLEDDKKSIFKSSVERTEKSIEIVKHRIDSLQNAVWENPYKDVPADKVLHRVVEATYSYLDPFFQVRGEETSVFYLTPDGKKALLSLRKKNNQ